MKIFIKIPMALLLILPLFTANAQDIPLFSQKLTDSFIYNPAMAGLNYGSVTFAHRGAFSNVEGSGEMNYLSFNMPLVANNFGVGLNIFNEKVNFLNNTFAAAAFAYHVNLGGGQLFSMGVSGEYNNIRPDMDQVVGDASDQVLQMLDNGDFDKMDFSAGLNYTHPYFKVGLGMNRLSTAFESENKENVLSQYFTAQVSGLLPIRKGKDLLEPTFTYRKYSRTSRMLDFGMYYTYNSMVLVGGSVRTGSSSDFSSVANGGIDVINLTAGFRIMEKFLIGYSRDMSTGSPGSLGASNEITLRFDFVEVSPETRMRSKMPSSYQGTQKMKKKAPGRSNNRRRRRN